MSLWPEATRLHYSRRRDGLQAALSRLEDLRAEMVAKLDRLDGDADLEPSLGAPELDVSIYTRRGRESLDQRHWASGASDDREGPDDDLEPSLGSLCGTAIGGTIQAHWSRATSGLLDGEVEHDGCEPEEDQNTGDDEPDTHDLQVPDYVSDHDQMHYAINTPLGVMVSDASMGAR